MRGKIKFYNEKRRFGFIVPEDGGPDVFLSEQALRQAGLVNLLDGEAVQFTVAKNDKGREAVEIKRFVK